MPVPWGAADGVVNHLGVAQDSVYPWIEAGGAGRDAVAPKKGQGKR